MRRQSRGPGTRALKGGGESPSQPIAIPPEHFDAALKAHLLGLGHMERFEYDEAEAAFRQVHNLAPKFLPGTTNLAIALWNRGLAAAEGSRGMGAGPQRPGTCFPEALQLLGSVIERDPDNLTAHYCRGLVFEAVNQLPAAHQEFQFVVDHDPDDAHAWYKLGTTLLPAGRAQADTLIEIYSRALACNPNLVPALFRLQQAYAAKGQYDRQEAILARWRTLSAKGTSGAPAGLADGAMGQYARILDWNPAPRVQDIPASPPRFDVPTRLDVTLPPGARWIRDSDPEPLRVGARASARPLPPSTRMVMAGSIFSWPGR